MQKKNVSGRDERVGGETAKGKNDFEDWIEFEEYLKKKGFPPIIIATAKSIHVDCIKKYKFPERISYKRKPLISFKTRPSLSRKKTVYAYAEIQKNAIKIFLSYSGKIPSGNDIIQHPKKPTEFIIKIQTDDGFTTRHKMLIKESNEFINARLNR